jgi:hypothetical protein
MLKIIVGSPGIGAPLTEQTHNSASCNNKYMIKYLKQIPLFIYPAHVNYLITRIHDGVLVQRGL